jgi:hypothetical protein
MIIMIIIHDYERGTILGEPVEGRGGKEMVMEVNMIELHYIYIYIYV